MYKKIIHYIIEEHFDDQNAIDIKIKLESGDTAEPKTGLKKVTFDLKPSRFDARDYPYVLSNIPLRESVDLLNFDNSIDDQYELGSCSANALINAYELLVKMHQPNRFVDLSRLFLYYNTRSLEGTVDIDGGAFLRDGIYAIKKYGLCSELLWPYDVTKFKDKPTENCYRDAERRNIRNYRLISNVNQMMDALNNNLPVAFGMSVYEGFLYVDGLNPVVRIPYSNEPSIGGHAMVLVGYDKNTERFIAKNSFGKDWGEEGYCYIPFEYARKELYDCWVFDIELK